MIVRYEIPQNWIVYDAMAIMHTVDRSRGGDAGAHEHSLPALHWQTDSSTCSSSAKWRAHRASKRQDFPRKNWSYHRERRLHSWIAIQRQASGGHRPILSLDQPGARRTRPMRGTLVHEVHRKLDHRGTTNDHCPPVDSAAATGTNPASARRVTGRERDGGECAEALRQLVEAECIGYLHDRDPLVQGPSRCTTTWRRCHPFPRDGDRRPPRAMEALMLHTVDLVTHCSWRCSNY